MYLVVNNFVADEARTFRLLIHWLLKTALARSNSVESYVKPLLRRAQLYDQREDTWDKALEDYQRLLTLDSSNRIALEAIQVWYTYS